MEEIAAKQDELLAWFYPAQVLRMSQREEELNHGILEGMRTGQHKYTPNPEFTSYARLPVEPVSLDAVVEDLCTARFVMFGKDVSVRSDIVSEQNLLKALVPNLHNKNVMLALPSGHYHSMGGLHGMTVDDVLTDPRFSTECDTYLTNTVEILKPVLGDTIFFPDDKIVHEHRNKSTAMLHEFRERGHVFPIERIKTMSANLREFFNQTGHSDTTYFFGSNLWTLNQFAAHNILWSLQRCTDPPLIKVVNQDGMRVSLAMRGKPVEPGIYRITHQPSAVTEYVFVNSPRNPITVTSPIHDQIALLTEALQKGSPDQQLLENGATDGTMSLYRTFQRLNGRATAAEEEIARLRQQPPAPEPVPREVSRAESLHDAGLQLIAAAAEPVKRAADWYNNLILLNKLETLLDGERHNVVSWEEHEDYPERHGKYAKAKELLPQIEKLLSSDPDGTLGIKNAVAAQRKVIDDYEADKKAYDAQNAQTAELVKRARLRGTQNIPVYVHAADKSLVFLTALASVKGSPRGALEREISDFLAKMAEPLSLKERAQDGLHALVAETIPPAEQVHAYASRAYASQDKQRWHKLGYRVEFIIAPSVQQNMKFGESLELAIPEDILDGDYMDNIRPTLEKHAKLAGIQLPTEEQVRSAFTGGQRLFTSTTGMFAMTLIELANGEIRMADLADQLVKKYNLKEHQARSFLSHAVGEEGTFGTVLSVRKDGRAAYYSIHPDYLKSIKQNI